MKAFQPARIFLALCALAAPAFAEGDKDSATLTIDVPAGVQATIAKEKGYGKVVDFRKVSEGDVAYVAGLLIEGKKYALSLDSQGNLLRKELDADRNENSPRGIGDIPAAVRKTLERESIGATIKDVEVREPKKTFAAEFAILGRKYSIEVSAEGHLLKKEYVGQQEPEQK